MDATEQLKQAIGSHREQCLLFLGAGFSRGIQVGSEPMLDGDELRLAFNKEIGATGFSLPVASFEYLEKFKAPSYVSFLREKFTIKIVPEKYKSLNNREWIRIYTTNYDNAVELATSVKHGDILSPINSRDPNFTNAKVVHTNGYIDHLSIDNASTSFKLRFADYDTDIDGNVLYLLQRDMQNTKYVIFCGYSLYDLDIRRALNVAGLHKDNVFFVTRPDVSDETRIVAERYGTVVPIGTDAFLAALEGVQLPNDLLADALLAPQNFEAFDRGAPLREPVSNDDVLRLYTFGGIEARHFTATDIQPAIVVSRDAVVEIELLVTGGERLVALHSDIGNGKSAALQQLMLRLTELGRECYLYSGGAGISVNEKQFFESRRKSVCLVFDSDLISPAIVVDYADRLPTCTIIYGLRSAHIELRRSGGWEKLQSFAICELNTLKANEVSQLSSIFDTYGLWGDHGRRDQHKILSSPDVDFRSVLLHLFNTSRIRDSLQKSVKEVLSGGDAIGDIFVLLLLLSYLGLRPSNAYVQRLSGMHALAEFVKALENDDEIAENIRYKDGKFRYYSPIFSEFVLKEIITDKAKSDAMLSVFEKSENFDIDVVKSLRISLMRFGAIAPLFRDGQFRAAKMIGYYDALSRMKSAKDNYLFWLQFAIACNAFDRFELADRYFGNAYRLAERSDPYQIDNHYAKFLIKSRMMRPDIFDDAGWAFSEAHKLSIAQFRARDEAKFPLEVFSMYSEFLDAVSRKFDAVDRESARATLLALADELNARRVPVGLGRLKNQALDSALRGIATLVSA